MPLVLNLDDAISCVAGKRKVDEIIKNLRTAAMFLRKLFQTCHYNISKNRILLKGVANLDRFCSKNDLNLFFRPSLCPSANGSRNIINHENVKLLLFVS